jgi:hypothetical protein
MKFPAETSFQLMERDFAGNYFGVYRTNALRI